MTWLPHYAIPTGLLDAALMLAAKVTILLLVAWLVTTAFRKSSASFRHLVWLTAVAGCLCLPFLPGLLPDWEVVPGEVSIANLVTPAMIVSASGVDEAVAATASPGAAAASNTARTGSAGGVAEAGAPPRANWPAVVTALWLLGFAVVLARLTTGL